MSGSRWEDDIERMYSDPQDGQTNLHEQQGLIALIPKSIWPVRRVIVSLMFTVIPGLVVYVSLVRAVLD